MKRRSGRDDPDHDAEQLARAMADVVPLPPDKRGHVRATPATPALRVRRTPTQPSSPLSDDDEDQAGGFAAPGVDRRELRKLKRGDYPPGGRLDLHGMTVAEASATVLRFLDASRGRDRCVCIVHGQGRHSGGNVSVLKPRVREWLRAHPAVLAYADAPPSDGGAGAVYVLLRK